MGHIFKHFDYEINNVKVEGDTATVEASFTNVSLMDAFAAASIDYQSTDTTTLAQIYQEGSAAGLEKKLMELLYKRILFPRLILSILTAFLTFLLGIGITILYLLKLIRLIYAERSITWY